MLFLGLAFLSGCPDNGSSNNGQPQIHGVPNGTVTAYNDPNTYCQFNNSNRTFICHSRNQMGQACSTQTVTYQDLNSLCQQVNQMSYNMGGYCNVSGALQRIQNETCQYGGLPGQNNGQFPQYPGQNQNVNPLHGQQKAIQCQYRAYKTNSNRFYQGYFDSGLLSQTYQVQSGMAQEFPLTNIYPFGVSKMVFNPASKGGADQVTVSIKGLDGNIQASQTGFAGDLVKLDIQNNDGSMSVTVSCKGTSGFVKNATNRTFTKYACQGTSDLGVRKERVNRVYNYNSALAESSLSLAKGLLMSVTADQNGADNAQVQFEAEGSLMDAKVTTASYLKTSSRFQYNDGISSLDLSCFPQ